MNVDTIINAARSAGCIPRRHPDYWEDIQVFATPDALEKFFELAWKEGFVAGFAASGEGWNGECPFSDKGQDIKADEGVQHAMKEAWEQE